MSDSNELWQAVTELRDRHSNLEARMSAHDARHEMFLAEFRESRQERQRQMESIAASLNTRLGQFDEKMDEIREKVSEAHGAAKFGKWVIGILISLGFPAGLFAWYTHGGPPQ